MSKYKFSVGDEVIRLKVGLYISTLPRKKQPRGPGVVVSRFKREGHNWYVVGLHENNQDLHMVAREDYLSKDNLVPVAVLTYENKQLKIFKPTEENLREANNGDHSKIKVLFSKAEYMDSIEYTD